MPEDFKFISKDLSDAASEAINMEDQGYALYIEAAKKSKNPLAVATFKAIAEKEKVHKQAIEDFYRKITGKEPVRFSFEDRQRLGGSLKSEVLKDVSKSLDAAGGEPDAEMLKAYETAMDMEKKSYEMYRKIAGETDDPEAKKLFSFLLNEENSHYNILQETHLYLSNPAEWFHKEEKWLVEG